MNTSKRIILAIVFCGAVALSFVPVKAQGDKTPTPAQIPQTDQKETYDALVKRVKGGDLKVDFGAMRQAYTETPGFSGYGNSGKYEMYGALNQKKFKDALSLAEKRLEKVYVDLNGHYVAMIANSELKQSDKAEFHRQVFLGLVDSIVRGHDGLTPATAYDVISIDEEKLVISYLGFEFSGSQALVQDSGHAYDRMGVTDSKTKTNSALYFRIDRFFGKF
ncbi:MAG: DUF4919 domain-containing protein [Pyrinomonadaceae bacterium]